MLLRKDPAMLMKYDEYRKRIYRELDMCGKNRKNMKEVRFRQDAVDLKPLSVVILAGINDIAGNTGPMTLEQT
jgi:hypothetical protein